MDTKSTEYFQNRLNSIIEQASELENNNKIPSWDSAKVIYDEFLQTHNQILRSFPKHSMPLIDYNHSAQGYRFDKMIQIIKVKSRAILDALMDQNENTNNKPNSLDILENYFLRFHSIARQLKNRYNNRKTLDVVDEYEYKIYCIFF